MIAIISDIHGNYTALKEVLRQIDKMSIKNIYCLGDTVGYYTEINECCRELRERGISSVLGNHDWYFANNAECPRSKSVNDCLRYQKNIIEAKNYQWLCTLPTYLNVDGISMVHGGWLDNLDEYIKLSSEYFENIEGKYFMSGHTHVQQIQSLGDKVYCNPGSVGQPRDSDPRSAFATFDGENFKLHRVEYDIEKVGRLMDKAGFSGYYYGCLRTGAKNLTW